ncbi:hypothetical protein CK203_036133 [Vitis vinifera]|uniref:Tf2-1-like SH3-like domain-containing protein n=1 Tax=Vitis vinifera TaxID=29760 RepID=A0A438IWX6_VITVI|nr:hypothetical protein CK203_036133 [Vitis vinifera]
MKQTMDKSRKDVTFDVGEMVFLKLHPYRQQLIFKRAHQKLVGHFYEPYPIVQKIGMVAYKLQLSEGARIHPIFHILDTHWVKRGNKFEEESLVQWKRLPVEEATWETTQSLIEQFPHMDLGDKVSLDGGGIVKPRQSERGHKPNPKYLGT